MKHKAIKVVIITEKLISEHVTKIIEEQGGTGYTITSASGKGSRGIRSSDQSAFNDTDANVKIEAILSSEEIADKIIENVVEKYFANYSGIAYLEDVRILRPKKFEK